VLTWLQKGVDINGEAVGDAFGSSISLSSDGNVIAIGGGPLSNGSIAVHVYTWSGSDWEQKGLGIDGEASGDNSGCSVSLSSDGNVIAIGAPWNNDFYTGGHVRVYEWNGSKWLQKGFDIDGEASGNNSGCSVSLSSDGNVVAIGAYLNSGNCINSGHVRVYEWNVTSAFWEQKGFDIDGEAAGDWSGFSVSLSSDANIVAIGAPWNKGNGFFAGHVRVYEWNDTLAFWEQRGDDIDSEAAYDEFGTSVSLSSDGNVVAIGAPYNDCNGTNSGHVRVYEWNGSDWEQRGIDIDGEAAADASGRSVSLSSDGNVVAIGADNNNGRNEDTSGHVRVYEWNVTSSSWEQKGIDIDGKAAGDYYGTSVSLSGDGNVIAIGAPGSDGNGDGSGHVRVYKWNVLSSSWEIKGFHILNGEAGFDYYGTSVSLSSDGNVVAIGAPGNDNKGDGSGHVRCASLQLHLLEFHHNYIVIILMFIHLLVMIFLEITITFLKSTSENLMISFEKANYLLTLEVSKCISADPFSLDIILFLVFRNGIFKCHREYKCVYNQCQTVHGSIYKYLLRHV